MLKIAIIIPKDLVKIAKLASKGFQDDIHIIEGSMARGLALAKEYEGEGYDVIIARGGTQLLLKSGGLKIPTVPIPVTSIDIFNAFKEAEEIDKSVAIIAFDNMFPASESFVKIAKLKLPIYQVANEREVEEKMLAVSQNNIKVAIGGGIIVRYGLKYGVLPIVIKTGKEAIISAIQEARRVGIATREENKKGERFRTIVENSNDGIISIDKEGYIRIFNHTAEKLLNIRRKEVIGKHISDVVPEIQLYDTLYSGIEETEVIKNINDKKVMVSKIPIRVNDEVVDALAIIQDVNKIQQMEEKIRREITLSGHYAKYTFNDFIGCSRKQEEIIRVAKEYAKVNSTILIEGETGTGKEVMAQSIHNYSDRANGPFVAVNCAAIPENLLESELFGYAPGAFTGADRRGKRGLFELANTGTIFLDEIAEMNPLLQGRLLRVLQEKQVMRIGDNKVIPIDVKVIAATNKTLFNLVREKSFREDLYYRVNILKIELLPLRKKKEDISYFISHFIDYYSCKLDKPKITLSFKAMEYVSTYDWPGNVRELRNFIERLMVVSKKVYIQLEDISNRFFTIDNKENDIDMKVRDMTNNDLTVNNFNYEERVTIKLVLEQNRGIINVSAKELGISRTTLWRKMKKYNLNVSK
ncbi:sigma 54-interacting transcriptional regulator [Clostridium sp.]|uniref:sigma 54-interacting transcriptional regulator n=1 Tax=Clostridium sp. TaxID=1506 RepID=UPI001A4EF0C0|nr:sigma 54-interacting transcriptional regulator [Clostridium sp.]MBK5241481.1 sigma 54-interacting transcriptional regulator [Clostridium sp.]